MPCVVDLQEKARRKFRTIDHHFKVAREDIEGWNLERALKEV